MGKTEEIDKSKLELKSASKPGGPFGIHSLNNFREVGSYTWIAREITDEMGFPNCVKDTDDCHYCEGQLFVMRHGAEETSQSTDSFGQVLTIINHETRATNIFTRAVHPLDSNEWTAWQMVATGDPKLITENNDINEVLSTLRLQIENDSRRIETAENSLLASATVRFDRIEENEATINAGEIGSTLSAIVYYKPANVFVAADSAGNYWDAWDGMEAYMSGGKIRENKVYLCGSKVYISTNSCLIQINNSFVFQGIEELIALYLGDGQSHTLGIRQVVKSSGRISFADVTLGINHYIDGGIPDSYPTGVKEYWYKSAREGVYYIFYIRVNWDSISDVAFSTDTPTETITLNTLPSAFSVAGSNLLNMLQALDYDIIGIKRYNSDGIAEEFDIEWRDGTENTVTLSDYNVDILEYNTLTAKYNDYIQVVQVCEYNELGELIKKITTIKNL